MTSERKYEGKGNHANPTHTNGSNPEQTANSEAGSSTPIQGTDAAAPAVKPTSYPKAEIQLSLKISTHSQNGGISSADTLLYALMAARSGYLEDMLTHTKNEDFSHAHAAYEDMAATCEMIDELAMAAISQAEQNYWAGEYKDQPERWQRWTAQNKRHRKEGYAKFMKSLTGKTAEELD